MSMCAKSQREQHKYHYQHHGRDHPSFSSTLLDAIYRSFDENTFEEVRARDLVEEEAFCKENTQKQLNYSGITMKSSGACLEKEKIRLPLVDQWMEKMESEKIVVYRRTTAEDFGRKLRNGHRHSLGYKLNSSSSSSDSSSGGGLSSSDTESLQKTNSLKPIRTNVSVGPEQAKKLVDDYHHRRKSSPSDQKPKAKSRAMKIYGDPKKVKQPISPGGRLASFLNSLFNGGSPNKQKISPSINRRDGSKSQNESRPTYSSTSSTASSFSRSCLSKTPSSAGKFEHNGVKRSVRFCPESVIVDEDSRPCGRKSLYGSEEENATGRTVGESILPLDEEFKFRIMEENRRIEEVARELLKNYHKRGEILQNVGDGDEKFNNIEVEDDSDTSCCSSDLFELDNFLEIGVGRYNEELPVYETTHVDTNRAIANGLIV
ncbi:hypothetical protein Nepgr_017876 [Nepenthes gracilis]|uniref:Protein BIG GRAIN 1-like B n=1 Tax=Nepenthes gracilis TaxID=150966 RepID=A0AAD3XTT2_NEPGR|nr:hypothetical protein Nepgr_017876 [Nepenthes gracilis]